LPSLYINGHELAFDDAAGPEEIGVFGEYILRGSRQSNCKEEGPLNDGGMTAQRLGGSADRGGIRRVTGG